jgi:hypothetical protein
MSDSFNYFDLDDTRLDDAWRGHSKHVFDAMRKVSDLRAIVERCKARVALVKATVSMEVRRSPEDFEVDKVTDASVAAAVASNKRVTQAEDRLIDAKHDLERWEAAVTALDHRKKALENLVTLHGQGYFSEPSLSVGTRRAMEDTEQRELRGVLARKGLKSKE